MTPTQRVEQLAFDCYYEIAALPLLHTDAVCNIIQSKFNPIATELERVTVELQSAGREMNLLCQDKQDLKRQVEELNEAWNEMHCCDDVNLEKPLAKSIANLRDERDQLRAQLAEMQEQFEQYKQCWPDLS